MDFLWAAVENSSLRGRVGRDAVVDSLGLALEKSDHLEAAFSGAGNDLAVPFSLLCCNKLMMEDLIAVAVGVNQQAMAIILFDLIQHPNEWSDSCPKRDYDVVLPQLSRSYFSRQNPSPSHLCFAFVQVVTAQPTVQPSFSYLFLNQFDKQIDVLSFHPSDRVLPAYDFIDVLNKIPEIQLQFEIPDELNDVSLVLLDEVEVFLVALLKLFEFLPEERIRGGVDERWRGFVDEEVVVDDEADVEMGGEEFVEG